MKQLLLSNTFFLVYSKFYDLYSYNFKTLKLKQIKPLGKENSITLFIVHSFTDYMIILNDP